MANLSPMIEAPMLRRARREAVYDCGEHGKLTRRQIARAAGITPGAAWHRLHRLKLSGAEVLQGTKALRRTSAVCRRPTIAIAVKLVARFAGQQPTWQQIQAAHPMTKAAAIHWAAALRTPDHGGPGGE